MLKKMFFLNPVNNKKTVALFSVLFFLNSLYYAYHTIFTPFVPQAVNCNLIYLLLFAFFAIGIFIGKNKEKIDWEKSVKTLVIVLLPGALLMMAGYFSHPNDFKRNPRFFANVVAVLASFILFLKICRYEKIGDFFREFSGQKKEKKNYFAIFILAFFMLVSLGFGSYHLSKFAAVDEPLWTFERVPKFWNNVLDGEWKKTMISDKPGITVAIISGIGLNWANPAEFDLIKKPGEIRYAAGNIEKMNFSLRFPLIFFSVLMLGFFYFFLAKLFNKHAALLATAFIGFSPLLLGMSRIINPDAVFWIFSVLSLLAYFIFVKNDERKYLFASAVFLGFSLLTKYVANFFLVFYFFMIFSGYVLNKKETTNWSAYFKKSLVDYFAIVYLSLLIFFLFLPAAWVDFQRLAEGTIFSEAFLGFWKIFIVAVLLVSSEAYFLKGKIIGSLLNWLSRKRKFIVKVISLIFLAAMAIVFLNVVFGMKWINFEEILASPKSSVLIAKNIPGVFLANFYPLVFGIHPLALFLTTAVLLGAIFKKNDNDSWIAHILIFIFLYYIACFMNKIGATVRYQIAIYPLIFIVASLGIDLFLNRCRWQGKIVFIFTVAIFLITSLNGIKPFYFSYASELLPRQYVLNLKDMGDGSYEAAQYLNNLPNAKDLVIWTDKRGVCYFFKGGCMDTFEMNQGMQIDYFVVSASRQSRTERHIPYKGRHNDYEIHVDKIYENENYDYKIEIGGRPNNFVKIFSYEKLANE